MKKYIAITLTLIFLLTGICFAYQPYAFLFVGRWQPAEDPLLIDEYGYQDIQNLRRDGKRLRGVSGHSKTTNNVVDSTYKYIRNGFHFTKENPEESHILVYSQNSSATASRIYQNTTAIPDVGDYSTTVVYSVDSNATLGRFSNAPRGNMLYADGEDSMIWAGDELRVAAFITSTASVASHIITNAKDYTDAVTNASTKSGYTATIAQASDLVFLVGSTRPLQGVKLYISTANTGTPSLTCKEWDGSAWSALSITDNTSGLKQTGTITWASTVATSKQKYMEGYILYWYQFELSAGTAAINYVTVNAPWQNIVNIWDGSESIIATFFVYDGSTYVDYTDEVTTSSTTYYAVLDSLNTTHAVYVGFVNAQQGLKIRMLATKENSTATVMTVKYWNGSAWVAVSNLADGTSESATSLYKTGVVTWSAVAKGSEFPKAIAGETPVYYYQLTFSVQLDAEVEAYYVTGIPKGDNIPGYRFPGFFQSRAFLFSEKDGEQNKAIYSSYNAPDVWGGSDSGSIYFGDEKRLTGAAVIYNYYKTSGIYQLIVFKRHETYRLYGTDADSWEIQKISGQVGLVAPLSLTVCEIAEIDEDTPNRHVIIWQGDHGVFMSDGATIQPIYADIACYFDPNDPRYIPADRIDDSVGWYNPGVGVYKLLISSGAGQTTHNIELEYSLKHHEWTKIYRENATGANPLQAGWQVIDTDGNIYCYGSTDEGYVYRLEHGANWGGTTMTQYVHTKDLLIDAVKPFFRHTTIKYFRLSFEDKAGANVLGYLTLNAGGDYLVKENDDKIIISYGEEITVDHYCNQVKTQATDDYQHIISSIGLDDGPFETQDCVLGPCLSHSFKLSATVNSVTDGLELTGMGFYYDPLEKVVIGE